MMACTSSFVRPSSPPCRLQVDGSGNFVDVLAARAKSANKGHCEFGIMNMGKCYLQNSLCCSSAPLALDEEGLHNLVLQDLHSCLFGSAALRDREERLLRLRPPSRARGHSYGWSG